MPGPGNLKPTSDKPERSMPRARAQRTSTTAFPVLPVWPSWLRLACRHQTCRKRMLRGCPWIEAGLLAPNVPGGKARSWRQGKDMTPSPQEARKAFEEQHGHARQTQAGQCRQTGKRQAGGKREAKLLGVRQRAGGSYAVKQTARWSGDQTVKQSDGPKDARQRDAEDGVINDGSQSSCALQPLACACRCCPQSAKREAWLNSKRFPRRSQGGASRQTDDRQATCFP